MLDQLDHAAIDNFVAVAGPGSGSPLVSAEIRHVGGALSRPAEGHGALGTFDASFLTFGVGMVMDEESYAASREQLHLLERAFASYDTGRQYLNFTEETTDPARFYRPENYLRLQAIKAKVDPDDVFRSNHPIPVDDVRASS
jgi:FAD/FMN-containing dehydrogenase